MELSYINPWSSAGIRQLSGLVEGIEPAPIQTRRATNGLTVGASQGDGQARPPLEVFNPAQLLPAGEIGLARELLRGSSRVDSRARAETREGPTSGAGGKGFPRHERSALLAAKPRGVT
jgi:hypothetical protein